MHRVQIVTERCPGHRLPPVVAWQLDDAAQEPVESETLTEGEMHLGDLQDVDPGLRGRLLDGQCGVRRR